ncbi:outer membrane protein assembly factor BamA [Pontiella sulfatireligans]|uniref:Outer membrane protein assembly factor BamA n=1 Tax=Pontiella sulfatireligans TaxID=2750658 RepID=A0A6C2UMJ5_9BACT|nr:outer membrane protein assembly factor BamA [Pontiella sulfatireligans]VGO20336.1 Outer membrane protein assembly factor BamA [Pontiella sulfatireligans]
MKKALTLLFACLALFSVQAETVTNIRIVNQAGESYDLSSVAAFTSFKIGEEVADRETILASIAVDVNRMRESGRYSYVNARMDVEGGGVILVYTVQAKHRIRSIRIAGADKMRKRKVLKKSELEIGQFADDATFAQATEKLKEAYRDFWYPDAKITWSSSADDELGVVDLTLRVKEGGKLGIKKIVFEGNEFVEDKKLRKVMAQKQRWFLSFITGAGKYKPEDTDMDVFAIKSLYMNAGFLDVVVYEPVLDSAKPKKSRLVIKIDEGRRYSIGKVAITGMEEFSEQELRYGVRLRPGDVAAYASLSQASESIRAYYGNRGYIRTRVSQVLDANAETGTVDVRYEITEGSIGYINKINILGNERTQDKVIRREIVIYPGNQYNRSRVMTSENILRNLNYFEFVTASEAELEESDKYDLNFQVKEKPTGQFSAGVGFSSVDSLVGYVELSQGNFDYKTWPPIGAGQKFKIRAQLGTERNDLDVSFVEPWFLNRKLSFGIDLFHREAEYFSDDYDQKNDGGRISLGKPLSRFTRGTVSYALENINVYDVDSNASDALKEEEGTRIKSSLDFTWTRDTRDKFFNPTRGNKTLVTPYYSGGSLGGETDIFGGRIKSTQYWPLIGGMVLNLRGQIESVEAYGDSNGSTSYGDGVPIFDRLFLGGSYTLRGFEYRDVGPKDPDDGEPVGGNSSLYGTLELTYPIWNKIRGATFYDWGVVNADSWDFDPSNYYDNWGIGLRFDLPGFPLHLDYAWPMTYDDEQDGKGRFNFLIGHSF